jgi:hypothetical protein
MTTPPVMSITDEQIAEIERFIGFGGSFIKVKSSALNALITRLREAEADAKRYRWLLEDCTTAHHGEQRPVLVCAFELPVIGWREEIARRIDAAMERTP